MVLNLETIPNIKNELESYQVFPEKKEYSIQKLKEIEQRNSLINDKNHVFFF